MLPRIIAFTTVFTLAASASASSLYKCQSASGRFVYSDTPCRKDAETIYKKQSSPEISGSVGRDEFVEPEKAEASGPDVTAAYVFRARVVSAISSLAPIKVASTEYHMAQGKWPKDLNDLGLDPKTVTSSLVDQVFIKDGGAIVANLNQSFGTHKKIVLTPKVVMGGTQVEWSCASNFTSAQLGGPQRICESRNVY